uniref:Helicase ATP-binding domain-containing protein n=1 Tax=viral metagenome TaxID=1070528 RepID=A0A6C0H3X8_9ZZZZ
MEVDITNFLLKYPNIDQFEDDILNPYDEDFYEAVYKKKEFYDVRLEEFETIPAEPGSLMNHQKLIARFLSSNTMYDELLLLHEMGSGKTCTAIGAIEQIREEGNFKGALYFAKGDALVNNFINELIFKCTDGRYIPDDYSKLRDLQKVHRTRKAINDYYTTNTFETFAKRIKNCKNDKELSKLCEEENFNNNIIVIDEVHNLRMKTQIEENGKKTSLNVYNQFYRFLHVVKDCKILLMSGTPMKDGVDEIASVMNLILPDSKKLPTGIDFLTDFFNKKDNTYIVKKSYIDELKNAFKGRVSYLRSMRSSVEKVFQENGLESDLVHMIVYKDEMSKFQTKRYEQAYEDDGKENKGVWADSRQASLFVFPNESIGKEGFLKYIIKKPLKSVGEDKKKTKYSYSLSPDLIKEIFGKPFGPDDHDEALEKLHKYSSKYAASIKTILEAKEKGESVFVYNEFVSGSGLILFGLLLELFGFSKASGNEEEDSKKNRYATLTSQTSTDKEIGKIVNRFNKPDNMRGEIINVIIGSRKISEGFTFKNVQIVDIHTPWFNYSETSQVIARGHRLDSHKDLIDAGYDPKVSIYQRVSIPEKSKKSSIDLDMYKTSEDKDISIKGVERIMKESAWDCALSYKRNFVDGLDGKRECDYTFCDYKCDGFMSSPVDTPSELDYSTFNNKYDGPNIQMIIDRVILLFRTHFKIDLDTLTNDYFKDVSQFELISALSIMINDSTEIINKYGFPSYLKENRNIFFLVDSLISSSTEYYTEYTHLKIPNSFESIIRPLYLASLPKIIYLIKDARGIEDIRKVMIRLPNKVQEQFIESSIQKIYIDGDDPDNPEVKICNLIIEYFTNSIFNVDDKWISKHLDDPLRCFDTKVGVWEDCNDEYSDIVDKRKIDFQKYLESSPYGYYGLYNPENKLFCLRDVRNIEDLKGHQQTSGKVCSKSHNHSELVPLIVDILKLPFPTVEDIQKIKSDETIPAEGSMVKMIRECISITNMDKETLLSTIRTKKSVAKRIGNRVDEFTSEEELRRILFWCSLIKPDMCSYIHYWLKKIGYYIEDDTCGSSIKTKPK